MTDFQPTDRSGRGLPEVGQGHRPQDPAEHRLPDGQRHQDVQPGDHQGSPESRREPREATKANGNFGRTIFCFSWEMREINWPEFLANFELMTGSGHSLVK